MNGNQKEKENENTKEKEKVFKQIHILNGVCYNLILKLAKSKIIITCNSVNDYISLYDNYAEISYSEFLNLGKCFKSCSDLEEIFNLLKNVLKGIKLSIIKDNYLEHQTSFFDNNSESKTSSIKFTTTDGEEKSLGLYLTIPLLSGIDEKICIEFKQKEKNIYESFKKLRTKYLNVKRLAEDKYSSNKQKIENIESEINNN